MRAMKYRMSAFSSSAKLRGFTLPEVMLALSVGSMVMLSAAKTYPLLRQQSQDMGQRFRLDQLLRQTALMIEKDIKRAGFCQGDDCQGEALRIGNVAGEAANSCLIVAYDLNRNGHWEGSGHPESDYFGFRLRQQALEVQRGVTQCQGNGWEKLLDPEEVIVSAFTLLPLSASKLGGLISLTIEAQWTRRPAIHRRIERIISGLNP
ncbi:prepilin peptidase-dependent protein [Edaphovirga cremea]|uniref:prepilin peptidase-dependent protein n=1 Tax=Edaphovirga cremea TaxID=2267246 RepID=UPI001FE8B963|nr:prepilin peptidase-dependent protein [Edaphovirga cremea]